MTTTLFFCVFSFHYVEDKEVCKDIVQDALLAYWERKEDFNDILKVKSFLYTVTRNKCLNYLKHAQLDIPFFTEKKNMTMDLKLRLLSKKHFALFAKR